MPTAKPTTAKPKATTKKHSPGRLYNLYQHNRIRLELPTGETVTRNNQEVQKIETFWIIGAGDANEDQHNYLDLTGDQVAAVMENDGLVGLLREGKLNLVNADNVV